MTVPRSRRKLEDKPMNANGFVVLPGQAPVLQMSMPGRSAALMLQSEATAESVMMFEETVPPGTAGGPFHLHRDSDEVMYVLKESDKPKEPDLADQYRTILSEAPVAERILAYHVEPIYVAAYLADVLVTDEHLRQYDRIVRNILPL
jgi:hypothetical protein